MGQKIHPVGFRVGVNREHESKWFLDRGYAAALIEDHHIRFLSKSDVSSPTQRLRVSKLSVLPTESKSLCIQPSPESLLGVAAKASMTFACCWKS